MCTTSLPAKEYKFPEAFAELFGSNLKTQREGEVDPRKRTNAGIGSGRMNWDTTDFVRNTVDRAIHALNKSNVIGVCSAAYIPEKDLTHLFRKDFMHSFLDVVVNGVKGLYSGYWEQFQYPVMGSMQCCRPDTYR